MKIAKVHPISGETNVLDLPVSPEQYVRWTNGELVQNCMPNLNADQREFLISGLLPGEFDHLIPEDEDDEDYEVFSDLN